MRIIIISRRGPKTMADRPHEVLIAHSEDTMPINIESVWRGCPGAWMTTAGQNLDWTVRRDQVARLGRVRHGSGRFSRGGIDFIFPLAASQGDPPQRKTEGAMPHFPPMKPAPKPTASPRPAGRGLGRQPHGEHEQAETLERSDPKAEGSGVYQRQKNSGTGLLKI
jgi:hypothetical protein